jgi:hypothetical protein
MAKKQANIQNGDWSRYNKMWKWRCLCDGAISEIHDPQNPPFKAGTEPNDNLEPAQEHEDYPSGTIGCPACRAATMEAEYFNASPKQEDSFGTCIPEPNLDKAKDKEHRKYKSIAAILDEYDYVIAGEGHKNLKAESHDPLGLALFLGDPTGKVSNFCLGPAAVYRSKTLEEFPDEHLSEVWVLDTAHLPYSGTHKDIRSAGILYWAKVFSHRDLVLWTAGNAGMSLARAVYSYNQTVSQEDRLAVYCVVFAQTPPEVAVSLRGLKARIAPIYTREAILTRSHTKQLAKAINPAAKKIIDVSDGWDGIGTFFYRLFIYNALKRIYAQNGEGVHYILAPVGTANLLAGAYLAAKDWSDSDSNQSKHRPKIIGVLPRDNENIVRSVLGKRIPETESKSHLAPRPPYGPKQTGVYSPLAEWVYRHANDQKLPEDTNQHHDAFVDARYVWFTEVDQAEQIAAGARLLASKAKAI